MTRISLSSSKLARPDRPIYKLASQLQDYLFFPVPDPLYATMGCVAGNMLKGSPIWLVLVGPPSSGRTELLETLCSPPHGPMVIPGVHSVSSIKGPAALISGVAKKDVAKGATGGLLREIGPTGIIVMKDFTSTLTLPRDPLLELLGAFREIFDGHWDRHIGGEGGRTLEWFGRVGMIAACTPVIDRYHSVISQLGERWIYYRYPESDGYGETKRALCNCDPDGCRAKMRALMSEFVESSGLAWEGMERREPTEGEFGRMFAMSSFVVAARSGVERDAYSKEVTQVATREGVPRLAGELTQMYFGLEVIGLEEGERWRVVGKVAMDSMPLLRREIISGVMAGAQTQKRLTEVTRCSPGTVRKACEDLEIHGVVERAEKGDRMGERAGSWRLSKWARNQLEMGWGL